MACEMTRMHAHKLCYLLVPSGKGWKITSQIKFECDYWWIRSVQWTNGFFFFFSPLIYWEMYLVKETSYTCLIWKVSYKYDILYFSHTRLIWKVSCKRDILYFSLLLLVHNSLFWDWILNQLITIFLTICDSHVNHLLILNKFCFFFFITVFISTWVTHSPYLTFTFYL